MVSQPSLRLPRIDTGPFTGSTRTDDHAHEDWSDIESFLLAPLLAPASVVTSSLARPRLSGRAKTGMMGLLAAVAPGVGFCLVTWGGGETDCDSGDACRARAAVPASTREVAIHGPAIAPPAAETHAADARPAETRVTEPAVATGGDGADHGAHPLAMNAEQRSASNLDTPSDGSVVEGRSVIDAPAAGPSSGAEPAETDVSKPRRSRRHWRGRPTH